MVLPGETLAEIYDRWVTRLLEQNVRVFLQTRGKVNQGIRTTLEHNPTMFFAYNNGLSATAEDVELRHREGIVEISALKNLQIVNGGQTTASIHSAYRKKLDFSDVFVQVKLSIVEPADVAEVVPLISEFANTQNRVSAADFFSNHPFHVRIEQISRRILAPSADGRFTQSKSFYERARGQYEEARSSKTTSEQKRFDIEFPKRQRLPKQTLPRLKWHGWASLML